MALTKNQRRQNETSNSAIAHPREDLMTISKNLLAYIATALIIAQNALFISSMKLIEVNQNIWLLLNTLEVVVLLVAGKALVGQHLKIALGVWAIALYLLVMVVIENFVTDMHGGIWVFTSSLLTLGLILASMYLFEK